MSNKYKAAVIGCGRSGSLFDLDKKRPTMTSHCGAYTTHKEIELIGICDSDIEKLQKSSDLWKVKNTYTDYQAMILDNHLDILSICTLPDTHSEIANFAAQNGVKAIFCEKPISTSLIEANRMIEACKANDVLLVINHQRRWDPFFIKLKEVIEEAQYGSLQHINFVYTRGIENSGSHLFDMLRHLFGEVKEILSLNSINDFENEETITASIEFNRGLKGFLIGLNGDNYRAFDLEIYLSRGKITIDSSKNCYISNSEKSKRSEEFFELGEREPIKLIESNKESLLHLAFNEIIAFLEGESSNISCSGLDGLRSIELIEATKESLVKNIPVKISSFYE